MKEQFETREFKRALKKESSVKESPEEREEEERGIILRDEALQAIIDVRSESGSLKEPEGKKIAAGWYFLSEEIQNLALASFDNLKYYVLNALASQRLNKK